MLLAFLACQLYVVMFIALHDWLPLGKLNNLAAIRTLDTKTKRVITTLLSTLPFFVCFVASTVYASAGFPMWLTRLLWVSYLAGTYGLLRAWYLPYLLYEEPARVARYQERFSGTHAFLPMRNGIRPDTLHVTFHGVFLTALFLLAALTLKIR